MTSKTICVTTAGDYSQNLPKFNLSERQVPINVRFPLASRPYLEAIKRLQIPGKNGPVMLTQVASVEIGSGPSQMGRLNRYCQITIEIELGTRELGAVTDEVNALPAMKALPHKIV